MDTATWTTYQIFGIAGQPHAIADDEPVPEGAVLCGRSQGRTRKEAIKKWRAFEAASRFTPTVLAPEPPLIAEAEIDYRSMTLADAIKERGRLAAEKQAIERNLGALAMSKPVRSQTLKRLSKIDKALRLVKEILVEKGQEERQATNERINGTGRLDMVRKYAADQKEFRAFVVELIEENERLKAELKAALKASQESSEVL